MTTSSARAAYRDPNAALEERRAHVWRELEEARKHRAELAASAAREKALEAELRELQAELRATRSMLDRIAIASPCKESWDEMVGDERVRFCGRCAKNVYNLSAMTREEAEAVIDQNERRVCVRLARRSDGTVVTNDCPVGARKKRVRLAVFGAAAAAGLACAGAAAGVSHTQGEMMVGKIAPAATAEVPVLGGIREIQPAK
jgi:hypothetical protein